MPTGSGSIWRKERDDEIIRLIVVKEADTFRMFHVP
jgi:hypothetical protein